MINYSYIIYTYYIQIFCLTYTIADEEYDHFDSIIAPRFNINFRYWKRTKDTKKTEDGRLINVVPLQVQFFTLKEINENDKDMNGYVQKLMKLPEFTWRDGFIPMTKGHGEEKTRNASDYDDDDEFSILYFI